MKSSPIFVRLILVAFLSAGVFLWSGCLSLSVNPLYDPESLVFEPDLVGLWGDPESPESETWEFQRAGERSYRLVIREANNLLIDPRRDGVFEARLVRLEDQLFLDLFPEEPEGVSEFFKSHIVPAHSIWKVNLEGHVLSLGVFDNSFVENSIQDGTIAVEHVKRDGVLVLTASTKDIQNLVSEHGNRIFEDSESLKRLQ